MTLGGFSAVKPATMVSTTTFFAWLCASTTAPKVVMTGVLSWQKAAPEHSSVPAERSRATSSWWVAHTS